MKKNKANFLDPIRCLIENWSLVVSLVQREVIGRYQGSVLGIFWSFANPLFMLGVYTFVFTVIFKSRWAGGTGSKVEFALLLFAGLIVFNIFAECVNRAPGLIVANANYVKKVVFPLEVLPWVAIGASLFHAAVSLLVWILAYLLFIGMPHASILLVPIIIFPLVLLILGLSWILASLGVYLRDVSQLVGICTAMLMFLSPIFYPTSALPESYHKLFMLNPLVPVIEQVRSVIFFGTSIDWVVYFIYLTLASIFSWLGLAWFQKTRMGFSDVI